MSQKVIEMKDWKSRGAKKNAAKEDIVDHGIIGKLSYEIYKRGVIHIFDKKLTFKKNIEPFEDEIEQLDFDSLTEGQNLVMKGSGDNDNLVFTLKDGELEVSLSKRGFAVIDKLKDVLSKGRNRKEAV